jgi:23S rRNA-/tRNA-specific pseudouridylate synthase
VLNLVDDLVAVDKPAGVPTIADHSGSANALATLTAQVLGIKPARLVPTSRLDRDVSGVVVFALTSAAAMRLVRARASGGYLRQYVAIAAHAPDPERGIWDRPIGRGPSARRRAVEGKDAVTASTMYCVYGRSMRGEALLACAPMTGRTHQIRVHAAHAAAALLGDRAYGGPVRLTVASGRVIELRRIALHAFRVVVPDSRGDRLTAMAPVPPELLDLWVALGGDPASWDSAAKCEFAAC